MPGLRELTELITPDPNVTISAPIADASASGYAPTFPNVSIAAPIADATASGLQAGIPRTVTAPLADATASALAPSLPVLISVPVADASASGFAPFLEGRFEGITTHHRLAPVSLLGETAHIIVSPSGQVDYPIIGDWTADESDMGGFQSASGTINAIDVKTKPEIYRYGSIWRAFHIQTGELEWAGMLMDPQIEGGNAQLSGRGWGQVFAERNFDYLLYQSIGTEGWTNVNALPGANEDPGSATNNWTTTISDHVIKFSRADSPRSQDPGFAESVVFWAPGMPDGEQLTRLAFSLVTSGFGPTDEQPDTVSATTGFSPGLHPTLHDDIERTLRTRVGMGGVVNIPAEAGDKPWAYGPTAPHLEIWAGHVDPQTLELDAEWEVLHIHAFAGGTGLSTWDVDLLSGWASGGPHLSGDDAGSAGSWSGRPAPGLPSALTNTGDTSYLTPGQGGDHPWEGEVTDNAWDFQPDILSTPEKPVNYIRIDAGIGHFGQDSGGSLTFADAPGTAVDITLSDIRVNGIAQGDHMSAGEIARDICTRLGLPTPYVDGGGWNVLPYVVDNQTAGDVLTYLATISNRRFRFLDSGARPYLEFGHYGDHRYTIADERQPVHPLPLERYDRVTVPVQVHGVDTVPVRAHLYPSPLPRRHDYGRIELDQAFRSTDPAERFAEDLLDHLSTQRFGGDAELVEVTDENGTRRSARVLHAGDVLRHAATDSNHMRISSITRSNGAVNVQFGDIPPIVERANDRRSKHLERTRNRHSRS